MLRIVLATARPETFTSFLEALSEDSRVQLAQAASGAEALDAVRDRASHLVVIDRGLPDFQPLQLIARLLAVDAMINTAVVSALSEAEFHEASEGLGVLARLPLHPGRTEALDLLDKLHGVLGLSF